MGYSCKLLDNTMERIILNARTKVCFPFFYLFYSTYFLVQEPNKIVTSFCRQAECEDQITSWLTHFQSEVRSISSDQSSNTVSGRINAHLNDKAVGLVIDGRTLMFALEEPLNEKFLDLARHCQAVLCCRATPLQKVSWYVKF